MPVSVAVTVWKTLTAHSRADISAAGVSFGNPMREIAGIGEQLGVAHHRFELKYGGHTFLNGFSETVISRDFLFDNFCGF